jgi:hypothetical protein
MPFSVRARDVKGRCPCRRLLRGQEGTGFPAALDCLRLVHADGPSASVENNNRVTFDGEQDAVNVRLAAIQKLTHLEGKVRILRGQRTTLGKFGERSYRFFLIPETSKPLSPA